MTNAWGRDVGIVEYLELTIKMKTGKESVHHREILAAPTFCLCSLHPICDRAVWGSLCHQSSTALAPQAVVVAWIRVVGPTEPWHPSCCSPRGASPKESPQRGPRSLLAPHLHITQRHLLLGGPRECPQTCPCHHRAPHTDPNQGSREIPRSPGRRF